MFPVGDCWTRLSKKKTQATTSRNLSKRTSIVLFEIFLKNISLEALKRPNLRFKSSRNKRS